ncbi:MAG: ERF family protein [Methanosphaera sp.]|nr:ERF family protein [Methanosphaera sp.]
MGTILNKNANGYGYKYTDLAEIHNYLESINSRYIQKVERIDNDDYIFTKRSFDNVWENEWIQGCRVVQATLSGIKNPAQEQGSALTYARRYSLLMAYGLATDDDDAASLTTTNTITKEDAENYVLDFGKHSGKKLTDVNASYRNWLYENNQTCKQMLDLLGLTPANEETLQLIDEFENLVLKYDIDKDIIYKNLGVKNNTEMTKEQYEQVINGIKMKHEV